MKYIFVMLFVIGCTKHEDGKWFVYEDLPYCDSVRPQISPGSSTATTCKKRDVYCPEIKSNRKYDSNCGKNYFYTNQDGCTVMCVNESQMHGPPESMKPFIGTKDLEPRDNTPDCDDAHIIINTGSTNSIICRPKNLRGKKWFDYCWLHAVVGESMPQCKKKYFREHH